MTIDEAIDAINEVHSDTSVSLQETLAALKEIYDHVAMLIDAVGEDVQRETRDNG